MSAPTPISVGYPYGGSSRIIITSMYLLASPNRLPNFQFPLKPLSSWKLGGERELSLNNYYRYHKLYFASMSASRQALMSELNVRAGRDG